MSTYAKLNAQATAETGRALSTITAVLSPRDRVLLRGLWLESCPAEPGNLPTLLNVYARLAHEHDVAQGRARHFAKLGPETAAESTRRARHCARAMSGVHDQIQQIIAAGAAREA